jgi:hypothetical protein
MGVEEVGEVEFTVAILFCFYPMFAKYACLIIGGGGGANQGICITTHKNCMSLGACKMNESRLS